MDSCKKRQHPEMEWILLFLILFLVLGALIWWVWKGNCQISKNDEKFYVRLRSDSNKQNIKGHGHLILRSANLKKLDAKKFEMEVWITGLHYPIEKGWIVSSQSGRTIRRFKTREILHLDSRTTKISAVLDEHKLDSDFIMYLCQGYLDLEFKSGDDQITGKILPLVGNNSNYSSV